MNMNNDEDVVYAAGTLRVSSTKQGLQGDSHEDQRHQVENRVLQLSAVLGKKVVIKEWFKFTESASGGLDMQPVQKAIEYCLDPKNKIRYLFFKSIDRFTRGGSTVYSLLKSKLAKGGVQLVDAYGVVGYKEINTLEYLNLKYDWSVFSPTTTNELAEAERSKDEVRTILTRMIGAEVNYVRLGYHVRPATPGYKNIKIETPHGIRTILAPHDIESSWFIKMFELRAQGNLTDQEVVNEINKMGYRSRRIKKHDASDKTKITGYNGEHPLTVKQLQRYIQNPIYAGVNTEKWTNGQPIKARFNGLVSVDVFNKANKGKITILETEEGLKVIKGDIPLWRMRRLKENPTYPYKQQVLCPLCRKIMLGSASRSKSGKHIPRYHCARNHKFWSVNTKTFNETVDNFIRNVKFSQSYRNRFREIVLEEWNKRKEHIQDDSIKSEKRVLILKEEQKLITEKIKVLSSPVAIKAMEDDLERLENEIVQAMQIRDRNEDKVFEIQTLANFCDYFMEHLEDLLIGGSDPLKNASLFGLMFNQQPTYDELVNGTPNLAPIFNLNEEYKASKSLSVTPRGIEPRFSG